MGAEMSAPSRIEAEAGIIGAAIYSDEFWHVLEAVRPEHFFDVRHRRIWDAILSLRNRNMIATEPALIESGCAPAEYIAEMAECAVLGPELRDCVKMVLDTFQRREMIRLAEEIKARAIGGDGYVEPAEILADAEAALTRLSKACGGVDVWQGMGAVSHDLIHNLRDAIANNRPRGLPTGILRLDTFMGGMRPGDLVIVAGASSMGKTSMARNIAYNVARAGGKVAFFSQEMSEEQIGLRTLSAEGRRAGAANVPYRDLDNLTVLPRDLDALEEVAKDVTDMMAVDSSAGLTALDVRLRSRAAEKRLGGLDLIVVDYLQIMGFDSTRGENFARAVGKTTSALKAIAKEFGCPVLLLSQLSRLKGREDKRPTLDDLRDSGAIEQDADKVIFVYREHYYASRAEPDRQDVEEYYEWEKTCRALKNKVEGIVAKNRMGRTGSVELWIDIETDLVLSDVNELTRAAVIPIHRGAPE
jgi:replicative DNA helicase